MQLKDLNQENSSLYQWLINTLKVPPETEIAFSSPDSGIAAVNDKPNDGKFSFYVSQFNGYVVVDSANQNVEVYQYRSKYNPNGHLQKSQLVISVPKNKVSLAEWAKKGDRSNPSLEQDKKTALEIQKVIERAFEEGFISSSAKKDNPSNFSNFEIHTLLHSKLPFLLFVKRIFARWPMMTFQEMKDVGELMASLKSFETFYQLGLALASQPEIKALKRPVSIHYPHVYGNAVGVLAGALSLAEQGHSSRIFLSEPHLFLESAKKITQKTLSAFILSNPAIKLVKICERVPNKGSSTEWCAELEYAGQKIEIIYGEEEDKSLLVYPSYDWAIDHDSRMGKRSEWEWLARHMNSMYFSNADQFDEEEDVTGPIFPGQRVIGSFGCSSNSVLFGHRVPTPLEKEINPSAKTDLSRAGGEIAVPRNRRAILLNLKSNELMLASMALT